MTELVVEFLASIGVDDGSSVVWGVALGSFTVAAWFGAWFTGEQLVNRLLEPGFEDHADQAIALSQEREATS